MSLQLLSYIDLPAHRGPGGFDHAAVHGASRRLYVAHTANDALDVIDCALGRFLHAIPNLAGVPEVIFFNAALHRLYVAIGDPGLIHVFDTDSLDRLETITSEPGAHTLDFDPETHQVYAFLPQTHRAAVYQDSWGEARCA